MSLSNPTIPSLIHPVVPTSVPFVYRDGLTMLQLIECIKHNLDTLQEYVNGVMNNVNKALEDQTTQNQDTLDKAQQAAQDAADAIEQAQAALGQYQQIVANVNTALTTANAAIDRLEALDVTDPEAAAALKNTIEQTATNLAALERRVSDNESDIDGINDNLNAIHANTVPDATALYEKIEQSNAIYAESIGCKAEPGFDNANIINTFFQRNKNKSLIFSRGDYECASPVLINGHVNIIMSPTSYLVYTGASSVDTFVTVSYEIDEDTIPGSGKILIINVDCNKKANTALICLNPRAVSAYINICHATTNGLHWQGGGSMQNVFVTPNSRDNSENTVYGQTGVTVDGNDGSHGLIVPVDYVKGVRSVGANNHYTVVHPWGSANNSIGFELDSYGTEFIENFVQDDSVTMFNILKGSVHVSDVEWSAVGRLANVFSLADATASHTPGINLGKTFINRSSNAMPWSVGAVNANVINNCYVGTVNHGVSTDIAEGTTLLPGKYIVNQETVSAITGASSTMRGILEVIGGGTFIAYKLYCQKGVYFAYGNNYYVLSYKGWSKLG